MFAKALQGQNIEELLSNLASAPVGGAAVAAVDAPAAKVEKGKNLTQSTLFCFIYY